MSEASTQSPNTETMRIDPARARQLAENLEQVAKRVDGVRGSRKVRLIAVSKLKPASDILALHHPSSSSSSSSTSSPSPRTTTVAHRDFGENYAQELTEKAGLLPRTIRWHMIGALQTNKCRPLAEQVPNLSSVSSVDSAKKADALEKGRVAMLAAKKGEGAGTERTGDGERSSDGTENGKNEAGDDDDDDERLRILVQVNTSGEEGKSGVEPGAAAVELCRHVRERCPTLRLGGFMTIGAIARSQAAGTAEDENADFVTLKQARDHVANELGIDAGELELSMGMSADFEAAIAQGSDEVRIGTTIFGDRPARKDAKVV